MPNEIAAGATSLSEGHANEMLSPWWRRASLLTMAVGFWNFLGAGIFGFLINLPIVSYFEAGTLLTINHGHAAMMVPSWKFPVKEGDSRCNSE